MGIRCCCPNGHKLNVKAEQAGKIGICPVCKLRFQIPFRNAQTPIREKESRPSSKRESAEDPFYLEPLPTLDDSQVASNKSAETPSSPESHSDLDLDLDFDLGPLAGFDETHDSTSESEEDTSYSSLDHEEFGNSVGTNTLTASSGEPEPGSGPDLWYFIGDDGQQYGPMSRSDVQDQIKDKRVTKTTRIWQEGGRVKEARDVFPELNEKKVNRPDDRLGCGGCLFFLLIAAGLIVFAGGFVAVLAGDTAGEMAMVITAILIVILGINAFVYPGK